MKRCLANAGVLQASLITSRKQSGGILIAWEQHLQMMSCPWNLLVVSQKVRAHLISALPDLAASNAVVGIDGEFWSPRKLLRRAVWHERDHTAHILKLLAE
jgi:hypothetical protein